MGRIMKNEYQDLSLAKQKIEKVFEANRRKGSGAPSLSRIFKYLRKHPRFSLFGDYPLTSFAITTMQGLGVKIERTNIYRAFRYSDDYKNLESRKVKTEVLDSLLKS